MVRPEAINAVTATPAAVRVGSAAHKMPSKQPLSVYAAALQCERGRVDHLHPGLFEQPEDDLATAQQRAADHLW
ncbi:MAG: hypothetical protein M3Y32_14275, partial [Pseudomonadota bacterium]|nr:hypothetical protein [Pseudomonadota bacterium]